MQDSREDCYLATLRIVDTDVHDSRPYYLVVENERGIDRHAISLIVEGMFTGALLILLFISHNQHFYFMILIAVFKSRSSFCLFSVFYVFIFHFIRKMIRIEWKEKQIWKIEIELDFGYLVLFCLFKL